MIMSIALQKFQQILLLSLPDFLMIWYLCFAGDRLALCFSQSTDFYQVSNCSNLGVLQHYTQHLWQLL